MVVKLRDRLPISAAPSVGTGVVRSCVRAMSSAVTRNRSMGFTIRPAISQPASTAAATPMAPMRPRRSLSDDEDVVDLAEAAAHLERAAVEAGDGENAVALPVHVDRPQTRPAAVLGNRAIGGVGGEHGAAFDARRPRTVDIDELRARGGRERRRRRTVARPLELRLVVVAGRRGRRPATEATGAAVNVREVGSSGQQRLVDAVLEALRRRHVRRDRAERTDERGDEAERGRDPPTKAHGFRIR